MSVLRSLQGFVSGWPVAPLVVVACLGLTVGCSARSKYAAYDPGTAADDVAEDTQAFNQKLALAAAQDEGDGQYRVGPEDLLEITLFDIESREGIPQVIATRVSSAGFVTLPHVGKVQADGLTPIEFEHRLKDVYRRFIHDPQITIFIREYHSYQVAVVGYVVKPDVLQLRGRQTMLEALAMAGGLNEDAGRTVRLLRETDDQIVTEIIDLEALTRLGNLGLNPTLLPNDVINVPRAGVFYVEGAVLKPGAFPLLQPTTVSQAIATAGGSDSDMANERGMTVYRKLADGQREPMRIDVAGIRKGEVEDMRIEEDDVIVIPISGPKWMLDRVLTAVRVGINYRP
ncbi:MAG: hypothetical protein E4H03_13365 [Myxococcales bacterium]|nr:MAG: hypothetical protein E4H03_13365 [Myxococcales bacterium]